MRKGRGEVIRRDERERERWERSMRKCLTVTRWMKELGRKEGRGIQRWMEMAVRVEMALDDEVQEIRVS